MCIARWPFGSEVLPRNEPHSTALSMRSRTLRLYLTTYLSIQHTLSYTPIISHAMLISPELQHIPALHLNTINALLPQGILNSCLPQNTMQCPSLRVQ